MADWLKKGVARRKFKNSGNFIHEVAQQRFDEAVPSFHKKIENALRVDANVALLFKQVKMGMGRPCTCNKYAVDEDHIKEKGDVAPSAPVLAPQSSQMDGVKIKLRTDNMFGDSGVAGITEESGVHGDTAKRKVIDLASIDQRVADPDKTLNKEHLNSLDPDLQVFYEDNVFGGSSVNCGLCFKTGTQPGFECLDHDYKVLTNYDIVSTEGYHLDQSAHPAEFQRVHDGGFVIFTVVVPLFFSNLIYSIRDNTEMLKYNHILDLITGLPVTLEDMSAFRGKEYSFKVEATSFTHVALLFDLNMEPLYINVTEESNTLDMEREDTVGSLSLVMPARIGHIISGDIIFIPDRNLCLKITDAPRKQKANRTLIEWAVQTRTLQPAEAIRSIARGYKAI